MRPKRFLRILTCGLLAVCFVLLARFPRAQNPPINTDLTVHEWGTFTSIAGHDGHAVDWLPLSGPADLPNFVEHFRDAGFKGGLSGTVRIDRKSTRLNSSHLGISYAVFRLQKHRTLPFQPSSSHMGGSGQLRIPGTRVD